MRTNAIKVLVLGVATATLMTGCQTIGSSGDDETPSAEASPTPTDASRDATFTSLSVLYGAMTPDGQQQWCRQYRDDPTIAWGGFMKYFGATAQEVPYQYFQEFFSGECG